MTLNVANKIDATINAFATAKTDEEKGAALLHMGDLFKLILTDLHRIADAMETIASPPKKGRK